MLKNIIYYIKDFVGRCIYFYENDEKYRKSSKKILLYFVIITLICLSINFFDKEWLKFFGIGEASYIMVSLFICIIWLIVQILYSFIKIPSDYIEKDMDELPDKIGKYLVIVQYNPPKGLNPSEVGILYNQTHETTNIDCLLYKRKYEGVIEMEDKGNGTLILHRDKEISGNVPNYEKQYWKMIFGNIPKERVVWKLNQSKLNMGSISLLDVNLLQYCIDKGRLYEIKSHNYIGFLIIICFLINPFIAILWLFSFVIYKSMRIGKEFGRTEKGDELYAHIIGYKYWLEKCEEKQILEILKKDSLYVDRNLPYVIALRMDWKFLDKKFNK